MDASRVNSFFQEHIDWELLVEERKYLRNFAGKRFRNGAYSTLLPG